MNVYNFIIGLCVSILFTAIMMDFIEFNDRKDTVHEKKSIVDTATMTIFLIVFYFLVNIQVGGIHIKSKVIENGLSIIGTILIMFGCYVNVKGRFDLGKNWANQIKIYNDHKLVNKGVYKYVRHPLYASIILMFYGACLVYKNLAGFIETTVFFIPFVYYRARQEEKLLILNLKEYQDYRAATGMLFPKLFRGIMKNERM